MPSPRYQFDHEKLDVYQCALQFITRVTALFAELRSSRIPQLKEVCDQLDRASISVVLNIAEGNGRRAGQARARFFDDSRGSTTECAGCLDVLVAKGACAAKRIQESKELLLRMVAMLTKLVERFDGSTRKEER